MSPSPPPPATAPASGPAAPPAAGGPLRHTLVFTGECLEGHDVADVQARVAEALKLDATRSAHLFSGRRIVLRRDLDTATALRRAARLAALGARVLIEPPPPVPAPSAPAPAPATAPPPDPSTPLPRTAPTTRPRLPAWALGITAAIVGTAGGIALAPHLSAWLWSTPNPASAPSVPLAAAPPAIAPAVAPAVVAPAAAAVAPAPASPTRTGPSQTLAAQTPPPPQSSSMPTFVTTMGNEARFDFGGPYSAAPQHRAFAISDEGAHGWTAGAPSENQARAGALERCIRTGLARGGCRVVDVNGVTQE